jgi:tRNA(Ile)-lysidine synthase
MVNSKKTPSDLIFRVESVLQGRVKPGDRLVLGLSGGLDSSVLLDILCALQPQFGFQLAAIHVNHQISPNAPAWAAFCRALCAQRQISCEVMAVDLHNKRGLGLEAAAREARYEIFSGQQAAAVVLAHHMDDQAETALLQLLRGAGVKGMSAMPLSRGVASGLTILRPLLEISRRELETYAKAKDLTWVEDESNQDVYYGRNFLRHEVMPLIATRFPAYRETFSRSARHFAEAAKLLDDLARVDATNAIASGRLNVATLQQLDEARAKNLLRYYFSLQGVPAPSAERLDEVLRQLTSAAQDASIRLRLGKLEIRRYRGEIYLAGQITTVAANLAWPWRGEAQLDLSPLPLQLVSRENVGDGICLSKLHSAPVSVRLRQGGERLQPDCKRPRRSLKNLLREADVPPWQREHLPLLFCGDQLVWVSGIGVDCAFKPARDELAVALLLQDAP